MRKVILIPDDKDREPNQRVYWTNFCVRVRMALEREHLACELHSSNEPVTIEGAVLGARAGGGQ